MTDIITVQLKENSYPIYIGEKLLHDQKLLQQHILGNQVCIVTNETIAPLFLDQIQQACQPYQCDVVLLPDGEQYKTLEVVSIVFDELIKQQHHRSTTIVALGGGVIGDMAGFAAACYQRGVNCIQVPTTLLAQVDASVGGKTAVNHPLGKNMIGAFHQPQAVIIDTTTLDTLPNREYRAGIAEIIKYGLLADADFFSWLEANLAEILAKKADTLQYAITTSCQIKAQIVAEDEKETGNRALLNLGHTFAHAIESATGYKQWLHGEAVAVGLCLAAKLSIALGSLEAQALPRIQQLLEQAGLPTQPPEDIAADEFLEIMRLDKKVMNKKLRLVLLNGIGNAIISAQVPRQDLRAVFTEE